MECNRNVKSLSIFDGYTVNFFLSFINIETVSEVFPIGNLVQKGTKGKSTQIIYSFTNTINLLKKT